jgi:hypothetical protein
VKALLGLVVLQAGSLLAWAGYHEHVRVQAPTFRLPLQLQDPYDLMRGRYFLVSAQDATIAAGSAQARLSTAEVERLLGTETSFFGDLQVGFCPEEDGRHRVCALARPGEDRPEARADFWARAHVIVYPEWQNGRPAGLGVRIDLDLERFFIPNRAQLPGREQDPGWDLEVSHRPGQRLLPRRLWFKGRPVSFD